MCHTLWRGRPTHLLTLTLRARGEFDSLERREYIAAEFKRLTRWLRRTYSREIELAVVPELTKKGMPHLHCLVRSPVEMSEPEIAGHWFDQTGAWQVDLQPIYRVGGAVNYLRKYLHKGPAEYKGKKRYWYTHGYVVEPEQKRPPLPWYSPRFVREHVTFQDWARQRSWYPDFTIDLWSGISTYGLKSRAPPEVRRRWADEEGVRAW